MIRSARTLLLVAGAGLGAWQGYVQGIYKPSREQARQHAPKRAVLDDSHRLIRRTFFNGGADDAISELLQTGDVVLLRRNALLEDPLTAAAIVASHEASRTQIAAAREQKAKEAELERRVRERARRERQMGRRDGRADKRTAYAAGGGGAGAGDGGGWNTYDDCALVFRSHTGLPHVAEPAGAGARAWKLTPYDEFVTSSDASLVVVRKLIGERSKEELEAARAFLEASMCQDAEPPSSSPSSLTMPRSLHLLGAALRRLWGGPLTESGVEGAAGLGSSGGGIDGNNRSNSGNSSSNPSTLHSAAFVAAAHKRMGIGITSNPRDVLPSDFASYAPDTAAFEPDIFVRAK